MALVMSAGASNTRCHFSDLSCWAFTVFGTSEFASEYNLSCSNAINMPFFFLPSSSAILGADAMKSLCLLIWEVRYDFRSLPSPIPFEGIRDLRSATLQTFICKIYCNLANSHSPMKSNNLCWVSRK